MEKYDPLKDIYVKPDSLNLLYETYSDDNVIIMELEKRILFLQSLVYNSLDENIIEDLKVTIHKLREEKLCLQEKNKHLSSQVNKLTEGYTNVEMIEQLQDEIQRKDQDIFALKNQIKALTEFKSLEGIDNLTTDSPVYKGASHEVAKLCNRIFALQDKIRQLSNDSEVTKYDCLVREKVEEETLQLKKELQNVREGYERELAEKNNYIEEELNKQIEELKFAWNKEKIITAFLWDKLLKVGKE